MSERLRGEGCAIEHTPPARLACHWALGVVDLNAKIRGIGGQRDAMLYSLEYLSANEVCNPQRGTQSREVPQWGLPWEKPVEYEALLRAFKDAHQNELLHEFRDSSRTVDWYHLIWASGIDTARITPRWPGYKVGQTPSGIAVVTK